MSRPASSSRIYRSDDSKDPIDLPPVLTDMIYHYDPASAVDLEPVRQMAIIRSITGIRLDSLRLSEDAPSTILRALGEADYDTLIGFAELFPYLQREVGEVDRVTWIGLLLRSPTIPALNELMRLKVIAPMTDPDDHDPTTCKYAKLVSIEGEIDTVRALGLFNHIYSHDPPSEELDWNLFRTKSREVAREAISILHSRGYGIEDMVATFDEEPYNEEPSKSRERFDRYPIFQELIDSDIEADREDRMEELMSCCIAYRIVSMVRRLHERYSVPISGLYCDLPVDLLSIFISTSEEIHVEGSQLRNRTLDELPSLEEEQLQLLLPLFPTWPIDPHGEENERKRCTLFEIEFVPKEVYYYPYLRSNFLSILRSEKSSLLNRMTPEPIYELFESLDMGDWLTLKDPRSDLYKGVMKFADSDKLRTPIRIALLKALRCERSHPWIIDRSSSSSRA